jgi:hypothetical protein
VVDAGMIFNVVFVSATNNLKYHKIKNIAGPDSDYQMSKTPTF